MIKWMKEESHCQKFFIHTHGAMWLCRKIAVLIIDIGNNDDEDNDFKH
jgi:hypothetical protein